MGSILSPGPGAARGLQGDGKAVKGAAHEGVGLGVQGQLCLRSPRDKQGSTPAPDRVLSPRALEGTGAGSQAREKKGWGGGVD